jgi:hydrogenase/urease accessory protein HupE
MFLNEGGIILKCLPMKKIFLIILFFAFNIFADVVKPALIEISIYPDNHFELAMRVSLESVITEISTNYKNTQNAPNAKSYDELRILKPYLLEKKFKEYQQIFLNNFYLKFDNNRPILDLKSIKIPIVGYAKVPRISRLIYKGNLTTPPNALFWQYAEIYGDNAVRYRMVEKDKYTWQPWKWLKNGASQQVKFGTKNAQNTGTRTVWQRIVEFIWIGYQHILPKGLDHILFIIGIALLSVGWRKLFLMVSTYTVAHTVTLGLSMYQIISLPSNIVEPLIAISIVYVAIENLWLKVNEKFSFLIVFLFGLLHGLGFATMLSEFNMAKENFFTTLLSFNLGVELGQITIIFGVLLLRFLYQKNQLDWTKFFVKPVAVVIAIIGIIWTFERIYV